MLLLLLAALSFSLVLGDPLSREENDHLQSTCGQHFLTKKRVSSRTKSMSTKPSNRNEAPFTVLLRSSFRNSTLEKRLHHSTDLCTGTLISPRHVLTAAHCLASKVQASCHKMEVTDFIPYFEVSNSKYLEKLDYFLIAAPVTCNKTACDSVLKNKVALPKRAFISKDWVRNFCKEKGKLRGDVAVIELEEDVIFTKTLQPACLYDKQVKEDTTVTIYGYGITQNNLLSSSGTMRKHKTVTIAYEKCQRNYKMNVDPAGIFTYPSGTLRFLEDEICSSHRTAMACPVDSGSGQIIQKDKKVYVAAVASYGPPCDPDAKKRRDTSASIFYHLDWVSAVTGIYPLGRKEHRYPEKLKERYISVELTKDFSLQEVGKKFK